MEAPTTRRSLLAAGLAAGALPLLPRWAEAAGLKTGEPAPFSLDILKDMAATLAGQPYAPEAVPQDDILESLDYDRHNQITFRSDAMLWGDVPGAAKVRFFHPGRYFKAPVRDLGAGGRHGAGDPVLARPFRHAEGQPGGQAGQCRLRRLRGHGPGRQERLDGGARGVLFPHLGLFGAVRHVGARAGDRQRRPWRGGVPALHPLLAGSRRRRAGSSSTRCSRARGPRAPTGWRPPTRTGCSRTSRRRCSCAGRRSTGWGSRR